MIEITSILGKQGGATITRLNESVSKLDLLMNGSLVFSRVSTSRKDDRAAVHNPELYHSLNRAAKMSRLHTTTAADHQRRKSFLNKIARHPELLGVARDQAGRGHQGCPHSVSCGGYVPTTAVLPGGVCGPRLPAPLGAGYPAGRWCSEAGPWQGYAWLPADGAARRAGGGGSRGGV